MIDIATTVSQDSTLALLLFYLFINYLFRFTERKIISNFADDNIICSCNLKKLKYNMVSLFRWFKENLMKAYPKKL